MRWPPRRLAVVVLLLLFIYISYKLLHDDRGTFVGSRYDADISRPLTSSLKFREVSKRIYSVFAMIDGRNGNMGYRFVRVLLMAKPKSSLICRFDSGKEVEAKLYEFSENHGMAYGVYYANCQIPEGEASFEWIQIRDGNDFAWSYIPVVYKVEDEKKSIDYEVEYSICVPALFGNKYSGKRLIEFLELNRLLGVQLVTLYIDPVDLTLDLKKVIDFYNNEGYLEVVELHLPISPNAVWYHAQLVTVTDCLNRHTGSSKYVAFHDLDEFMVPMNEDTFSVLPVLEKEFQPLTGSLRVPTQYMSLKEDTPPITLNNINHQQLVDTLYTKCVLRPEMVFEQGIHHTSRVIQDNYLTDAGDKQKLRLFHYKNRKSDVESKVLVQKYGEKLLRNYQVAIYRIFN